MNALVPLPVAMVADPVYGAMERHRQAYDVLMDAWEQSRGGLDLEDATEKQRWYDIETTEEDAFKALLATKPTTKAGAIARVEHVADIGLVTEDLGVGHAFYDHQRNINPQYAEEFATATDALDRVRTMIASDLPKIRIWKEDGKPCSLDEPRGWRSSRTRRTTREASWLAWQNRSGIMRRS
jgi:hypothetical protein